MTTWGLRFERVELESVDWKALEGFSDRVIFQTPEWLQFLSRTQGAEPVVAALVDGNETVGYFTGAVIKRYGVRVLGSPFPGWTTDYMGFNLRDGVDRRAALVALIRLAFGPLRCLHLELKDRRLSAADVEGLGLSSTPTLTFEVDLEADEDEIFDRMTSACRRAVRKSVKEGVIVEQASGMAFADEYYAQLIDVFAKQALKPTYDSMRVHELIRCLEPTGRLLLVRARSAEGEPLATALFPAMNGVAYFWGGASWRSGQAARPNEAIFWYAMRYWKARGMRTLDLGGGGTYKLKYGPREVHVPFLRKSRVPGLMALRDAARVASAARQRRRRT